MECFKHTGTAAVGIYKSCFKAVCRDCALEQLLVSFNIQSRTGIEMKVLKRIFIICAFCASFLLNPAMAGVQLVANDHIERIQSISSDPDGIVIIRVPSGITGCTKGVYIDKNDVGGKEALSIALSAFMADKKVSIYGNTDQPWPGQTPLGTICHLHTLFAGA